MMNILPALFHMLALGKSAQLAAVSIPWLDAVESRERYLIRAHGHADLFRNLDGDEYTIQHRQSVMRGMTEASFVWIIKGLVPKVEVPTLGVPSDVG